MTCQLSRSVAGHAPWDRAAGGRRLGVRQAAKSQLWSVPQAQGHDSWCPCRDQGIGLGSLKTVHLQPLIETGPGYPPCGRARASRWETTERRQGLRGLLPLFREEEVNLREEKKWRQGGSSKAVSVLSMAISAHLCTPSSSEVPMDPSATSGHLCCLAESLGHCPPSPRHQDLEGVRLLPIPSHSLQTHIQGPNTLARSNLEEVGLG